MIPPVGVAIACGRTKACEKKLTYSSLNMDNSEISVGGYLAGVY